MKRHFLNFVLLALVIGTLGVICNTIAEYCTLRDRHARRTRFLQIREYLAAYEKSTGESALLFDDWQQRLISFSQDYPISDRPRLLPKHFRYGSFAVLAVKDLPRGADAVKIMEVVDPQLPEAFATFDTNWCALVVGQSRMPSIHRVYVMRRSGTIEWIEGPVDNERLRRVLLDFDH